MNNYVINNSIKKLFTYIRLGILNVFWVVIYRVFLKTGLIVWFTKPGKPVSGEFFTNTKPVFDASLSSLNLKAFGWIKYSKINIPEWHQPIDSKVKFTKQDIHWSKIADFNLEVGDVKSIWELSRFDWLLDFTVEFLKTGDIQQLDTLNIWLEDWSRNNPLNIGINWKCGQEASIRGMHLCITSFLLNQHTSLSKSLAQLLEQHLSRITPTLLYAMAQDNNHGTSEAVALYIGGLVLEKNNKSQQARRWKNKGRYWIENRVQRLIADDGSFSQHSVN